VVTPDVVTPDVVTPDVVTPDVVTPDVVTPDVVTPDVVTPDVPVVVDVAPDTGTCAAPLLRCGSACVDVRSDPTNCRVCGGTCVNGSICGGGACVCPNGYVVCAGFCVDPSSSATHCGVCGNACPAGQTCTRGRCGCSCPAGQGCCGAMGACLDMQSNPAHCGACGNACAAGQACVAGRCACACPAGQTCCGAAGTCINTQTDPRNCGACGRDCNALPGVRPGAATCVAGVCNVTGACVAGRASCATPTVGCTTDITAPANCGACGTVCGAATPLCALAGATYGCTSGCAASAPTRCGSACVNTTTDVNHCGACGTVCPAPAGAVAACAAGRCGFTCGAGFHLCGTTCAANTAPATCGTSCTPCPAVANGTATCNGTTCGVACNAGFHLCGGACVSNSAVATCGASCTACPAVANGTPTCSGTACGVACNAGFHLCGGACVSNSAVATCGASCSACPAPATGTATCNGAACGVTCNAGYHLCGADCVLNTSPSACGTSCSPCPSVANGTATCNGTTCDFTCNAGFVRSGATCVPMASLAAPRQVWPPSTATVTSRRPAFRWALAAGTDGARVEVCRDRACATVAATFDVTGTTGAPPANLPAGSLFWRVRGRSGATVGTVTSTPWPLTVGALSAAVSTAWGSVYDANGDGVGDIVAGAPGTGGGTGRSWIYAGRAGAGIATPQLTRLTGLAGANAYYGNSVASAGDVNGDGYADTVIGSYLVGAGNGRVDLYNGNAAGPALVPSNTVTGPESGAYFGYSVAGAGDINGDGYADILVGGYLAAGGTGRAYVYYGSAGGITAAPSRTITSPVTGSASFGISVAGAGDVNGDGYADVIIGANGVSSGRGAAYVYLGGAAGLAAAPAVGISGPDVAGSFGYSVAGAGDLNGDGYCEVIVGAYQAASSAGRAYVFLGRAAGPAAAASFTLNGPDATGYFGFPVASAGDVNGDGYGDVIVGAQNALGSVGRAHIFSGGAGGLGTTPARSLTGPDGVAGAFGYGVAGAGDVNGDGFADVAVGAFTAGASRAGRVHVYHGSAAGVAAAPAVSITGPDGAEGLFGSSID
jgi:hypothetical protein